MKHLFCDCKTDEEKANFFLSGRAVETGIVASTISNDVAMAYHRCAEFQKEIDALRAKIEPSVPTGWKLVPIDPTRNMLDIMDLGSNMLYRYRALLAAAPEAKP